MTVSRFRRLLVSATNMLETYDCGGQLVLVGYSYHQPILSDPTILGVYLLLEDSFTPASLPAAYMVYFVHASYCRGDTIIITTYVVIQLTS